ncbi:MAG: hypothetical protein V4582_23720 [Pseudomonadota bacterium]
MRDIRDIPMLREALMAATIAVASGACAQAPQGAPAAAAVRAPIIADAEPQVSADIGALLAVIGGAGGVAPERLTDKARAVLDGPRGQEIKSLLQACMPAQALQLLARQVDGEDRHYRYRLPCAPAPLQVDISFNKAARVDTLSVRRE